jgi:hypothetical protein
MIELNKRRRDSCPRPGRLPKSAGGDGGCGRAENGYPLIDTAAAYLKNFDVFFALAPEEVTAIDALDTGVRSGPDPELVDAKHFPFRVEN